MAIPIKSIPVLEGEVARKFEKEARKAEKNRGVVKTKKAAKTVTQRDANGRFVAAARSAKRTLKTPADMSIFILD
ncbi:MAG: hypothetical protein LBV39_06985, partial [Bacteroidales bacterium]|nr:hypothetical protein [Bacteroidales bacterium]